MLEEVTVKEYRVSFRSEENVLKLIALMDIYILTYTAHSVVH